MAPKPLTPDDEIVYVNNAGIRKKKGKSGNSQKRADYFMQQRFPFLDPLASEDGEKPKKGKKKKSSPEEQQELAAPLARARIGLMQEYQKRLLVQQKQEENESANNPVDSNDQENSETES